VSVAQSIIAAFYQSIRASGGVEHRRSADTDTSGRIGEAACRGQAGGAIAECDAKRRAKSCA
jgi:hypothetical protein